MGVTYKQLLWLTHPDNVHPDYVGGCCDCPGYYWDGEDTFFTCSGASEEKCSACWERQIPYPVIAEAQKYAKSCIGSPIPEGEKCEVISVNADSEYSLCIRMKGYPRYCENKNFKFYIPGKGHKKKMRFKVGDKVRVRSWKDMENEFGTDRLGNKKFSMADIKSGMTIQVRMGDIYLVNGGKAYGVSGYVNLEDYREDMTCNVTRSGDIMNVCKMSEESYNLKTLLSNRGEMIYERKKLKEITYEEAIQALEEKFGCDVKIKEE